MRFLAKESALPVGDSTATPERGTKSSYCAVRSSSSSSSEWQNEGNELEPGDRGDCGEYKLASEKEKRDCGTAAGIGILGGGRVGTAGTEARMSVREAIVNEGEGDKDRCGGGDKPVNWRFSDTAEVAKLSSSSFSSTISSGMAMTGRSLVWYSSSCRLSTRNLRRDSGEISLERLPSAALGFRSSSGVGDCPRSFKEEELVFRLKSFRGEKVQPEAGDRDLAERLC